MIITVMTISTVQIEDGKLWKENSHQPEGKKIMSFLLFLLSAYPFVVLLFVCCFCFGVLDILMFVWYFEIKLTCKLLNHDGHDLFIVSILLAFNFNWLDNLLLSVKARKTKSKRRKKGN